MGETRKELDMDDTANDADMSAANDKIATVAEAEARHERFAAVITRLGVTFTPGDEMTDDLVAALEATADRLEAQDAEIAKLKSAKDAAQRKAKAAEAAAPGKLRKIGRMNFPEGAPTPAELRALLAEAETVEVVLSDGKSEIAGIAPRVISGDAWEVVAGGLKLNVPELLVHGPGLGSPKSAYAVAGYGLVIDGKQVAWAQRGEQITIGAGATFDLKDDVIF